MIGETLRVLLAVVLFATAFFFPSEVADNYPISILIWLFRTLFVVVGVALLLIK